MLAEERLLIKMAAQSRYDGMYRPGHGLGRPGDEQERIWSEVVNENSGIGYGACLDKRGRVRAMGQWTGQRVNRRQPLKREQKVEINRA